MKRDLKKWLDSKVVKDLINDGENFPDDYTEQMICEDILMQNDYNGSSENTADELIQFIWMEAQKQFLKDILDDIDNSIDKLFRGHNQVRNDKAQLVAYEASVKQWLYNKYHYLKRKNGV